MEPLTEIEQLECFATESFWETYQLIIGIEQSCPEKMNALGDDVEAIKKLSTKIDTQRMYLLAQLAAYQSIISKIQSITN